MSACIIPVAPNFQDPPSVPTSGPPSLSGFSPKNFGELVTVPVPAGQLFSANVTDLDPKATLRIRWIVDYPPYSDATKLVEQSPISPGADGQTINQLITTGTPVDCSWINQPLTSSHQLELVVADSDFLDSSNPNLPADRKLDSARDPNGVAYAFWPIVISCPASATSNTSSP